MGPKMVVWNSMYQLEFKKHNSFLYWSRMFDLINEHKYVIFEEQNVNEFASYLLDRILEFNDDDPRTTPYVLRILQLYTLNISGGASYLNDDVNDILGTPKVELCTLDISEGASCLNNDVNDIFDTPEVEEISHFDISFPKYNFLEIAMERRDTRFIKALMRFGFCPARIWSYNYQFAVDKITTIRYFHQLTLGIRDRRNVIEAKVEQDIIMAFESSHDGVSSRGLERFMLIISILHEIFMDKFRRKPAKEYGECINLLFRAIPDPFITRFEVEAFCCFIIREEEMLEKLVRTLMTGCDNIFGLENEIPYEPRSLKHLSRCVIRRFSMKSAILMPGHLKSLDIPKSIKDYLLCES